MKPLDLGELLALGAIWGSSFMFMRVSAPEFGPVALIAVRVACAAAVMLPLLWWSRATDAVRTHWRPLALMGLVNTAVPFCLFAYSTLALPAGFSAVLNATAALWGPIIGWRFFGTTITRRATIGFGIGFLGVVVMVSDKLVRTEVKELDAVVWSVLACLVATACYGFSANYSRERFAGVPSLAVAGGSQLFAAIALAPVGVLAWPAQMPSATAWACAVVLGLVCTAVAYLLYFRLLGRLGAAKSITVTLLIPVFGVLLGIIFLDERLTITAIGGAALVVAGTALALGLVPRFTRVAT
jgi:drug/metabolite transporter (DMT)-like permease